MQPVKIKEGIYWVGGIDWDLRNFHGYLTQRGSTYNAYLIIDEKITLIDTVKHYLYDEMIERISQVVDPAKIDYVVSNHVEMDHSGGLPKLLELAKNATVVTSAKGESGLKAHYKTEWNFKTVKSGDSLNLGSKNLQFLLTPMVHWPDNMMSYLVEDKILFSNDAFGQHLATSERFDDQYPLGIIKEEAAKYYANIVLPYGPQVIKALESASKFDIDIIASSHGIIWRSHIPEIIEEYKKWAANEFEDKAVIVYDTMWGSTAEIATAIQRGFENKNINTRMMNLDVNHISDIMTEVLTAKYICVGSPTINNNMLPSIASFLTYMKGLSPKKRTGLAFGSYGWGGQSIGQVEEVLSDCGFELMEKVKVQYVPEEENLQKISKQISKSI
ncbi:MAG: FprA family A-type flavoprotein [Firmicutes bacterium]|nr:FprA family A-type flavoprotein [Bacillota bacterium]